MHWKRFVGWCRARSSKPLWGLETGPGWVRFPYASAILSRRSAMLQAFVEDPDDPRIAAFRHLKATNLTRGSDTFIVEGPKLLERLIASPAPLVSVLATDRHVDRLPPKIPGDVPVYVLPF